MSLVFIFQLFAATIAFAFFANGFVKFFRGQRSQSFFKLLANSVVWIGIILFALFPKATHYISADLGFGESLNTFIFIGFIIVFMIIFKIITMIERVEKNISEMVRNETLSPLKNIHKND